MVLAAYGLNQGGVWRELHAGYLTLNIVGSLMLGVVAIADQRAGFDVTKSELLPESLQLVKLPDRNITNDRQVHGGDDVAELHFQDPLGLMSVPRRCR